ncbi:MAG: phenylalanine--tRNA ligase subunit alpha [Patescibacteria group bacterium]
MQDTLKKIKEVALKDLENLRTLVELELARVKSLGRSSELSQFLRTLKDRTQEQRKEFGQTANRVRAELEEVFEKTKNRLEEVGYATLEKFDVTAPGLRARRGHVHPLTQVQEDINAIFVSMGFRVLEGPEVETEWTNFDALNTPADHPARGMQDTFWLKDKKSNSKDKNWLMRTHTSPMQVRFMQAHQPPFRMIVPGRVYRNEATDATHEFQFHQIEGLMVSRKGEHAPSMANLKGVMEHFYQRFFRDPEIKVRFNASYFPFVEPGVEVYIQGSSGKLAGKWLEVAGAGMVHQNVFEQVGYVRGEMQGFAFGMALERMAMLKHKIDDIRLFNGGDLRFLQQF